MTKTVRKYPVLPKDSNEILFWVDIDTAKEMRCSGAANWIRVPRIGHSIRLTGEWKPVRDDSAKMGPSVIFSNACGMPYAQSITEAWA